MVSCQKGHTRHAYAWQIGPFWQDTLDMKYYTALNDMQAKFHVQTELMKTNTRRWCNFDILLVVPYWDGIRKLEADIEYHGNWKTNILLHAWSK